MKAHGHKAQRPAYSRYPVTLRVKDWVTRHFGRDAEIQRPWMANWNL